MPGARQRAALPCPNSHRNQVANELSSLKLSSDFAGYIFIPDMASHDVETPLLPEPESPTRKPEENNSAPDKRGIFATVVTMLLSIPALGE